MTLDGGTKLKSPSGTLSTAEIISVVNGGLAMAGYYGDGNLAGRRSGGGLNRCHRGAIRCRIGWCGSST